MSKRRENYEKGLNRLNQYLELLCHEEELPTLQDIEAEINAIQSLRQLPTDIHLPDAPVAKEVGYFILLGEHYERFDDVLPSELDIHILPGDMDEDKTLQQFLRMQP